MSSVLLVLAMPLAAVAGVLGVFLVMASDSCGIQAECSTAGIGVGVLVSVFGPAVGVLGFAVWTVVRLVRCRRGWWAALAGLLSVPALWFAGVGLVWLSVGGASR